MTKPYWMIPAAVVWVATRNVALADGIANQNSRHAAYAVLATADPAKYGVAPWADVVRELNLPGQEPAQAKLHLDQARKCRAERHDAVGDSLKELIGALSSGRLRARSMVGGRDTEIAPLAWIMPIMTSAQGLVVGATWECAPNLPSRKGRAVGGVIPFFVPREVIAVFPSDGGAEITLARSSAMQRSRVGRPRADNEPYINAAAAMIAKGDSETEVRAYLQKKIEREQGIGTSAASKRISGVIMPQVRHRIGKNSP